MAVLDKGMKQRMVGALVLVALAVIFLPMLFTRQDEMRQVHVEAPQAPAMPSLPEVKVEPVAVPEPQVIAQEAQQAPVVIDEATAPAEYTQPANHPVATDPGSGSATQAPGARAQGGGQSCCNTSTCRAIEDRRQWPARQLVDPAGQSVQPRRSRKAAANPA